jgi:5-oxopent-3-ene-1,2,5-tricarboxylate decarboxylase/2-hydroxyhepta-2,4-diene-1,7-dioate isomerase
VFTPGALRTRALEQTAYRIADAHPDNAFVYAELRVGHGRDMETRRLAGEAVFAAMRDFLKPLFDKRPLGLSLEVTEIDPVLSFKQNNTHAYVKARAGGG